MISIVCYSNENDILPKEKVRPTNDTIRVFSNYELYQESFPGMNSLLLIEIFTEQGCFYMLKQKPPF